MDSVSPEGNVNDINNRTDGDSNKFEVLESHDRAFSGRNHGSVKHVKSEQQKGSRREESKSKESISPAYDSMISMFDEYAANGSVSTVVRPSMDVSPVHVFEVGDMVWGKVKSHPWWPGHVYSEEFATVSVRRSKREGLLLVAFFGDSSYGWFHPSELMPFDSNFEEKSRQTNSKTFVKAVEEAMDEVSRRSALGLSCMCRSKQNFRETNVQGFYAVDVADYEPGAVYSIDAIEKARDGFQPSLALDFIRQLALEPTACEHAGIDFIKNKANVISYRRAVYEEFDETYAQAFGYPSVHPSPVQELPPGRTPAKAPLSGRQVFADTSGKVKTAKPNKLKDHAKKDKYLFKRRDEAKETKVQKREKGKVALSPQLSHVKDSMAIAAGDFVLQKRAVGTPEQVEAAIANDELSSRDATQAGAGVEDMPTVLEFSDPGFQITTSKVESPISSSAGEATPLPTVRRLGDDEKKIAPQMEDRKTGSDLVDDKSSSDKKVFTQDDTPSSGLHKTVADKGPKKLKAPKRPAGELESGKSVLPEKKKKRKKEALMSDGTPTLGKEGIPLVEKVSAKKPVQSVVEPKPPIEDPQGTDSKATTSSSSQTAGVQEMTGAGNNEVELSRVLGDLHSLALDPFHAINRGWAVKARQVFLRFRSVVFQKSLNLSSQGEEDGHDTHSSKSSATPGPENGTGVTPIKPQARPDDPTKGGRKRGPSDRQEEMAAKKKKKVGDIRNLTKEKKVTKKIEEPAARGEVKQAVVRKSGPESKNTEQRALEPTMLLIKFPLGASLPSINELKARFARYGPMDHSGTRIFWKSFMCRVVYRHKAHAQAAYKFVMESNSLFGNMDVKCSLKEVGMESEAHVKVPKEDGVQQGGMEDRQLKSCLKKSEGGSNGGKGMPRVKFMLGGESMEKKNGSTSIDDGGFSSSSDATMDINSKNFHKAVLPLPISTTSSSAQFTRPPPPSSSMHHGTGLAPSLPLPPPPPPPPSTSTSMHYGSGLVLPPPPPRSLNYGSDMAIPTQTQPPPAGTYGHNLQRPNIGTPKADITQQMLGLLTKCNEVVTNVTNMLGYVPYHPL